MLFYGGVSLLMCGWHEHMCSVKRCIYDTHTHTHVCYAHMCTMHVLCSSSSLLSGRYSKKTLKKWVAAKRREKITSSETVINNKAEYQVGDYYYVYQL